MINFLNKLKRIGKSWYTIPDLLKITGLSHNSLYVQLSRYVKMKIIIRLTPGIYILPEQYRNIEIIANAIYMPSYLSFETALSRHGILSQIPYSMTFATTCKTSTKKLGETEVEYRHIQPVLFFGYEKTDSLFIATPEKALMDTIYFISFGKSPNILKNASIGEIDRKELRRLARKYPERSQHFAEMLLKGLRTG